MKGYKGLDKDLKCRNMQYEVGKTYREKEAKLCSNGLHFCENPFDVFTYYPPSNSRFTEIEAGDVNNETSGDSKRVSKELTIKAEIGLAGLIKAGVEYIHSKVIWGKENNATGNYFGASAMGNYSGASATGYKSGASATGNKSGASATGNKSGASATGYYSGASATGHKSGASATGNYSGASATGYYSGASATGYKSGASATGNNSGASATGNKSGASVTGDYSGASATGDCSDASVTGDYSDASVTGDYSGASATGYKSGASATGNYSGASATGNYSGASATGNCSGASAMGYKSGASAAKGSVAIGVGMLSRARGEEGAFLVLTECEKVNGEYFIKDVKATKVDGLKIKADTWYTLCDGEFVEVSED
jgi:hypothetical protein